MEEKTIQETTIIKVKPMFIAQVCPTCKGFGTLKYGAKVCNGCEGKTYILIPAEKVKYE